MVGVFLHGCSVSQCHVGLPGDVPRPVGPHKAALSLVTDRETIGQLWASRLYSAPGHRFPNQ